MRRKFNAQSSLFTSTSNKPIARELEQISRILDETPRLLDLVYRDLVGTKRDDTGRMGLNAEQVLRCAVLKQYRQLSYEELAFHLDDSSTFRGFSRLEMGQYPCKSILQDNIKSLREETWEAIHEELMGYARREGIETGRKIRVDSTVVETDIHHPTDSTLLLDGIRVITRWLACGKDLRPQPVYVFSDHTRVAKKRTLTILNAKKDALRKAAYRGLLNAQMPSLAETTGQAAADLPERLGLSELTKHHGHELLPATEPFGASIGPGGLHGFKELASRK